MRVIVVDAVGASGRALLEALAHHKYTDHVVSVGGSSHCSAESELDVEVSGSKGTDDLSEVFRHADAVVYAGEAVRWFNRHHDDMLVRLNDVCRALAAARVHTFVCGLSVGAYAPAPMGVPVQEDWPTSGVPGSILSQRFSQADQLVESFQQEHPIIRTVALRMAPVVGPVDSGRPSLFEHWGAPALGRYLLGRLLGRAHRPIVPDLGPPTFQVVHVADMADAFCCTVVEPALGPYNIGGQPFTSNRLAESLSARTLPMSSHTLSRLFRLARSLSLHTMDPESLEFFVQCPVVDTSRAREELGWTPHHDIVAVVESFADVLSAEHDQAKARTG